MPASVEANDRLPSPVPEFLEAAQYAGLLIDGPEVGRRWTEPSALPLLPVGGLVGHMYLIVRRVGKHLEAPHPPPGGQGKLIGLRDWRYSRVGSDDDLLLPLHKQVRDDGEHVAGWGWETVRREYASRLASVAGQLADDRPRTVALPDGTAMALGEYLVTRIIELLVHADDLAVSATLDAQPLPAAPLGVALSALLAVARTTSGDRAVLRALTRPGRVRTEISIF